MSDDIRIYVVDLAAYNNGKLQGVWINALDGLDDIQEQINQMLNESPEQDSEEYAIHDYEGFGGYSLNEYASIESVHDVACFIDDYRDIGEALLCHFCGYFDDAKKAAEENYCGCYTSLANFAQELTEGTSQVPENLAFYIDYERMGRDWELSGDIYTIETAHDEVHVFWVH